MRNISASNLRRDNDRTKFHINKNAKLQILACLIVLFVTVPIVPIFHWIVNNFKEKVHVFLK